MSVNYCDEHVDVWIDECPRCATEQRDQFEQHACELADTIAALTLRAEQAEAAVARVRAACEREVLDRSLWSDDRYKYSLDRIDGWNDALEMVEQALDPQDTGGQA